MQLRLARPCRDTKQTRDLPVLESFHIVEHEYLSRSRRQSSQTRLELRPQRAGVLASRHHLQRRRRVGEKPLAVNRQLPPPSQHDVDRQPMKPRAERRIAAKTAQLLPRPDEYVLRDFVSQILAEHAPNKREHPVHMTPIQAFECLHVAARCQLRIGGLIRRIRRLGHGGHHLHAVSWIGQLIKWLTPASDCAMSARRLICAVMSDLSAGWPTSRHSVWLYTFGCKANQYDTERMRQELESRGAGIVSNVEAADTAVLNTCTVTASADVSGRRLVRKLHRRHPGLRLVVAGCSSALHADDYRAMAGVASVIEGHDPVAVAAAVAPETALARTDEEPIGGTLLRSNQRGARGWLKIQDGCDRKCSFCVTRLARGASRSRPVDEVIAEARLQAAVHSELVLTGIHIGGYGRDLASPTTLSALCASILDSVPNIRLRLGSIEATEIDDRLIVLLETSGGALAPHLHIPMQSGSDKILGRMRRWHTREAYRRRVLEIAARVGPLGLGADVIAGFPGETKVDYADTLELIEELPFSYLHVFPWSPRDGTLAADLEGRVPRRVAADRAQELRELGIEKGRAYASSRIGGMARVAVETPESGLTGDYLRVRLCSQFPGARPRTLVVVRLDGTADGGLRAGATGRSALPVLAASVQARPLHSRWIGNQGRAIGL